MTSSRRDRPSCNANGLASDPPHPRSRRSFVAESVGCAAWIAAGGPGVAAALASPRPQGKIVAEAPFARIEELGYGVWAVVSTPLGEGGPHFQTGANGGIVAGRGGVAVIEAFYSDEGAAWVADAALQLTGARPDRVILTHFHADHCRGLGAFGNAVGLATPTTHRLLQQDESQALPQPMLSDDATASVDLGGRVLEISPRLGHTPSDVTVRLQDPPVVWCGDLVWNRMFPNFVDAIPSHQVRHCERLLGEPGVAYVPGHGELGDADSLAPYLTLLQDVEAAARRAFEVGTPPADAAAAYAIPDALGAWVMFSDDYVVRAFTAWDRELSGDAG